MLLIDTSVLIQAHRTYYAFDICPGFWDSLIWLHGERKIISLDRVEKEILSGREAEGLKQWAKSAKCFEPSTDPQTMNSYANIQRWAQSNPQFLQSAKAEFAAGEDAWIIAYACSRGHTLVTMETYAPAVKRNIPMPNVCKAFNINCIDTYTMLQQFGVRFELQSPTTPD
jgi:hypothetical protein